MAQALYRRYRSARFSDLIGQEPIAQTLRNQVQNDQLAHAYLFTGIRGTGKTSTARILARAVNCLNQKDGEPCGECTACQEILSGAAVDVLEIDAASNRGIDEIRDLREKVNYLPASLRRKVYIIDEAHMLTSPAWNAFLKTLEEPPAHVVFVLATTQPHDIPETIRSRVQRFDFRRVAAADVARHLGKIAVEEGVTVEPAALDLLASSGQGSVRDAISLLDQVLTSGVSPIDVNAARQALGLARPDIVRDMLLAVANSDPASALRAAAAAFDAGADPRQLVRELARISRGAALVAVGYNELADTSADDVGLCQSLAAPGTAQRWVSALEIFNITERDLRQPIDARLQVEYALLRLTTGDGSAAVAATPPTAAVTGVVVPSPVVSAPPAAAVVEAPAAPDPVPAAAPQPAAAEPQPEPAPATPILAVSPGGLQPTDVDTWTQVWSRLVDVVGQKDTMLAGVLRDCRPLDAAPGKLVVGAPYTFHLDRLAEPAKRETLVAAVAEVGGGSHEVSTQFCGDAKPGEKKRPGGQSAATHAALETFKGSRVTSSRLRDGD